MANKNQMILWGSQTWFSTTTTDAFQRQFWPENCLSRKTSKSYTKTESKILGRQYPYL